MQVICINTSYPKDWIYVEPEDYLVVGEIYTVEEIMETEETYYYLKEKPKKELWRVRYNANRFVTIPENGEIPDFQIPEVEELSEEEDFIRKMKSRGIDDESIQTWLDVINKRI